MVNRKKDKRKKQRSTKHTHKTKDRVTRTPLKASGELRCWSEAVVFVCKMQALWNINLRNPSIRYKNILFYNR